MVISSLGAEITYGQAQIPGAKPVEGPVSGLPLSETASLKLVQNFITAAFGCLAFLRGLFPDDHFIDDTFQAPQELNQLKPNIVRIKRLKQGVSDSADTLISWIVSTLLLSCRKCYSVNMSRMKGFLMLWTTSIFNR